MEKPSVRCALWWPTEIYIERLPEWLGRASYTAPTRSVSGETTVGAHGHCQVSPGTSPGAIYFFQRDVPNGSKSDLVIAQVPCWDFFF